MKQRLSHETREQTEEETSLVQDEAATFDSVDALLRHDAASTAVPPRLQDRVLRSVARESQTESPSPWWKRWMPF